MPNSVHRKRLHLSRNATLLDLRVRQYSTVFVSFGGHFSRISQLYASRQPPCDVPCAVSMLTGCRFVFAIGCCAGFTSSGARRGEVQDRPCRAAARIEEEGTVRLWRAPLTTNPPTQPTQPNLTQPTKPNTLGHAVPSFTAARNGARALNSADSDVASAISTRRVCATAVPCFPRLHTYKMTVGPGAVGGTHTHTHTLACAFCRRLMHVRSAPFLMSQTARQVQA